MTSPAGWYDDPQDPSQIRYWDGAQWSGNVTAKAAPPAQDPVYAGQASAHLGQALASGGPGAGQVGQPYGGRASSPATTPDGVLLAGWGSRAAARLLDGLFTSLLGLPLTGWFFYRYVTGLVDWANEVAESAPTDGSTPVLPSLPVAAFGFFLAVVVVGLLVTAGYEIFFLRRSGATPGKKIMGISVRLRDRSGPPPMKAILGRTGFILGISLVSGSLIDDLWPLWDEKKQALHDKVVGTNVVVGPQPGRPGTVDTSQTGEVRTDA